MEDNLNLNEASGAESQRVTPGDNTSKIVGAILLAGVIIAGAPAWKVENIRKKSKVICGMEMKWVLGEHHHLLY